MRAGLGVADGLDAFGEEGDALVAGDSLRQQGAPAVFRERAGEEGALTAHRHGFLVEVVHELVDEREGDELDLIGGEREFADEEVAAGVEAALGFGGEHGSGVFGERRAAAPRLFRPLAN